MFSFVALAIITLASSTYASPLEARQSGPCSGLGSGTSSTAGPFSLYAYNPNGSNTNSSGIPLVLAPVPSSSPPYGRLATYASYGQGSLTSFSLTDNTLVPADNSAVDLSVASGTELEWQFVSALETPAAAPIYCVVNHEAPTGLTDTAMLAVNGETGSFSLCQSETAPYIDVVYEATSDNGGAYEYETCESIIVHVYY